MFSLKLSNKLSADNFLNPHMIGQGLAARNSRRALNAKSIRFGKLMQV